jgi:hypothetical protein
MLNFVSAALALVLLVAGATSARAQTQDERADLRIDLIGLPLGRGDQVVQVRITNASEWWADATTARVQTIAPGAGHVLDIDVENLDPGQTVVYTYALAAPCDAHVVKAEVAAAKNYAGVAEAQLANNLVQAQVCSPRQALQSLNFDGVVPIDPNAPIGSVLGPGAPQPSVDEKLLAGTHTITLWPDTWKPAGLGKVYDNHCGWLSGIGGLLGHVGWGQSETGEFPNNGACGAEVFQVAVQFERQPLDRVRDKTVNRVVLTYEESPGVYCPMVLGYTFSCWQSGDWKPEHKPDGCVVVRVPSVDWANTPTSGLIPYSTSTHPAVVRLGTREWDVTEPFSWQNDPKRYIGLVGPGSNVGAPGHGFLLTGGPSLDELTADDSTICISQLTNVRLLVTYTVPPPGDRRDPVIVR